MATSFLGASSIGEAPPSVAVVSPACVCERALPSCADDTFWIPSIDVVEVEDDSPELSDDAMLGEVSRDSEWSGGALE